MHQHSFENMQVYHYTLTLLHSEWPKLYGVLAVLSAIWLKCPNAQNIADQETACAVSTREFFIVKM